jgi:homocitrate synthase NifV
MNKGKIYILDVTNRDGVQTSRLGLAKLEKTILNTMLNQIGVFQAEIGFPNTRHELNYLNANLELVEMGVLSPMRISGWTRATVSDVSEAKALVPQLKHINISTSTSDQMIMGKYGGKKSRSDIITVMLEALNAAKELRFETIGVNAEDASRTELSFLIEFCQRAQEQGADRIRYCDTLGYDDPLTIYARISRLARETQMPIELHCHNDLGMAVGCSVAGAKGCIDAGQDAYINTTVNGVGERAGNADMLSVILALSKSSGFDREHAGCLQEIDLTKSYKLAKYAAYSFDISLPVFQVGVGDNAFAHESGIHADGALKDRRNYELYDCEELGRGQLEFVETGRQITTGEYGGIKGFQHVFGKLDVAFKDEKEAREILDLVRFANVHTQKPLTQEELIFIARYPMIARKIMTVSP